MTGVFDWGLRYALYRKWTGGYHQTYNSVNVDVWRHWIPLFCSSIATSVLAAPFEVASAAYFGDKTFPAHLRYNYRSIPHALVKIAYNNPFALYKNSLPSIMASFIQTSFAIGIHDFFYDLMSPLHQGTNCPRDSVKFVFFNKFDRFFSIDGKCIFISSGCYD